MPSYKTSTLSLMVLWRLISLPILIILAGLLAMYMPDSYTLASWEKLLVAGMIGTYVLAGMQMMSAYLQRSNSGWITASNIENATVNNEKPIEEDLSLNKLEAYDPSDK